MLTYSGGIAALSNYKPSTLLVEIPDSNIDSKLGVKNLVVPNKTAPPVAKSRITVDKWSANNGSVIYAQSNIVKTGFNCTNGIHNSDLRLKESQSVNINSQMNVSNRSKAPSAQKEQESNINRTGANKTNSISPKNHQELQFSSRTANGTSQNTISNKSEEDLNNVNLSKWSNGTCLQSTSDLLF